LGFCYLFPPLIHIPTNCRCPTSSQLFATRRACSSLPPSARRRASTEVPSSTFHPPFSRPSQNVGRERTRSLSLFFPTHPLFHSCRACSRGYELVCSPGHAASSDRTSYFRAFTTHGHPSIFQSVFRNLALRYRMCSYVRLFAPSTPFAFCHELLTALLPLNPSVWRHTVFLFRLASPQAVKCIPFPLSHIPPPKVSDLGDRPPGGGLLFLLLNVPLLQHSILLVYFPLVTFHPVLKTRPPNPPATFGLPVYLCLYDLLKVHRDFTPFRRFRLSTPRSCSARAPLP